MSRTVLLSSLLVSLAGLCAPAPAAACSRAACEGAQFNTPSGIRVPANAVGVPFSSGDSSEQLEAVAERFADGAWQPAPVTLDEGVLRFDDGLTEGDEYEVSLLTSCGDRGEAEASLYIVVGPPAELPEGFGGLVPSAKRLRDVPVPTDDGSCSQDAQVLGVEVALEEPEVPSPWRDLIVWQTLVDGERWAPTGSLSPNNPIGRADGFTYGEGGSWVGRGRDLIYASCEGFDDPGIEQQPGVAPGLHQVELVGWIPGMDAPIATEVLSIDLTCADFDPDPEPEPEPDPCPSGMYGPQGACHPGYSGGGGCAVAGVGHPARSGLGFVALFGAALLFRRRR